MATQSPNETVRVAVIGLGGRGSQPRQRVVAHAERRSRGDLRRRRVAHRREVQAARVARRPKKPTTYVDIRKLLEDKDIDAVSIATPNHWHTLQTIWACQAGKDVYVEKPCSHNVFESQQIVAAARKYNRIVQQGSQSRSSPALREAVQKMREGEIGEIYMARGLCYKWRDTIGKTPVEPVPPGVDYDLWLGPAPQARLHEESLPLQLALVLGLPATATSATRASTKWTSRRWGLGVTHPTKVSAIGGKFMFDDDQETPNTIDRELRVRRRRQEEDDDLRGAALDLAARSGHQRRASRATPSATSSTARRATSSSTTTTSTTRSSARSRQPGPTATEGDKHCANFIDAVRSRKREDLNAEIEEGALSCNLMHLANISYRLGRTLHWDAKKLDVHRRRRGEQDADAGLPRAVRRAEGRLNESLITNP